jgi:type II secretory pathway component HofQ
MCDPVSMMALSVASTAASLKAQQDAADSQTQSNNTQYASALEARAQNANQVTLGRDQARDQASQKQQENNLAQREAQATQVARAGPSGLSVDALLADIGRKGGNYNQSVNANLDKTNMAFDNQLQNVNNQASTTINSLKTPAPVDYLGAALKIGEGYQTYQKNS